MLGAMVINLSAPAQDVCHREQTGYGEQGTHVNSFWGAAYEAASGIHDRTARLIPLLSLQNAQTEVRKI